MTQPHDYIYLSAHLEINNWDKCVFFLQPFKGNRIWSQSQLLNWRMSFKNYVSKNSLDTSKI